MNGRSRTSPRKTCSVATRPPRWRLAGASVSRNVAHAATSSTAPMPASATKIPRQSVTCSSAPPTSGSEDRRQAADEHEQGEEARRLDPLVQVAHDRARDDDPGRAGQALHEAEGEQQPDGRSRRRTAARRPCRRATPVSRGRRRPSASLSGPATSWPQARPSIEVGDRQLRRPRRRREVAGHRRQPGQVHVHRQRVRRRTARRGARRAGHGRCAAACDARWDRRLHRPLYRQLTRACLLSMAMKFPRHLWTGEWRLESEQAREAAEEEAARRRAALAAAERERAAAQPAGAPPRTIRLKTAAAVALVAAAVAGGAFAAGALLHDDHEGPAAARRLRQADRARQGPVARRQDLRRRPAQRSSRSAPTRARAPASSSTTTARS